MIGIEEMVAVSISIANIMKAQLYQTYNFFSFLLNAQIVEYLRQYSEWGIFLSI